MLYAPLARLSATAVLLELCISAACLCVRLQGESADSGCAPAEHAEFQPRGAASLLNIVFAKHEALVYARPFHSLLG